MIISTAEAFKPYEIARAHGFHGKGFQLNRKLQPASSDLPRVDISLSGYQRGSFFGTRFVGANFSQRLLGAHFSLSPKGAIDRFIIEDSLPDSPAMTVFTRTNGLAPSSPYYAVFYRGDDPNRARIISVALMEFREYGGSRGSGTEQIAKFGPENGDRKLYAAFLKETGLPEVADLLGTMRIYLEGQFREDGQMVPLTVEALARKVIMASA